MASLREEASYVLDDAKAGISWIAIWKTGRTWHAETLYFTEYIMGSKRFGTETHWEIDKDDQKRLMEIYEEDHKAILVNPYYCNLGPWEEMTLATLIDGIRFQYGFDRDGEILDVLELAIEPK